MTVAQDFPDPVATLKSVPPTEHPDPLWDEIARLLEEASQLNPQHRPAYLQQHASTPAVASEVLSLLGTESIDDTFLESGAGINLLQDPLIGQRAGDCLLLRTAGAGGMGTVYEGLRSLPLAGGRVAEQRVAVKIWHAGAVRPQEAVREARLLARLDHPHIARLLDTGHLPDGRPFLVMEFVEGKPLLHDTASMDLREKLSLFRKICDAVDAAHRALIVHRDLKPSNILLTASGEPKLIDFGIGRSMEDDDQTIAARLTPGYASPEQIRGEPLGTPTDVYSLGVILYEWVDGSLPRPGAMPRCPQELASIMLKAMAEEPARRYGSARALSDDLARFLNGEPVAAIEATAAYRLRKFLIRHRWSVAAGLAAAVLVAIAFVSASREKRIAELRFNEASGLARTLLYEIHDEVAKTPGTLESRRLIANRALEYLDRLSASARGDERLQADLAEGYTRIGDVQGSNTINSEAFALYREAAVSFGKAVAIWEQLYQSSPHDRKRRASLANAVEKMAQACSLSGQEECERTRMAQAEKLFREDADGNPADLRAQVRWLAARIDAQSLRPADFEPTRLVFREVAAGFDSLLQRSPDNPQVTPYAAYAYKRLGALEGKLKAHSAGVAQYQKALRLHEKEGNLMGVSTCYVDIAWIEQDRKNSAQALAALDRALQIRRNLAKNRGADLNFKNALLSVMVRKAVLLEAIGQFQDASAVADEALNGPGAAFTFQGQDRRGMELLIEARKIRANALAKRGDRAAAARDIQECMRLFDLMEKNGHKPDKQLLADVRKILAG